MKDKGGAELSPRGELVISCCSGCLGFILINPWSIFVYFCLYVSLRLSAWRLRVGQYDYYRLIFLVYMTHKLASAGLLLPFFVCCLLVCIPFSQFLVFNYFLIQLYLLCFRALQLHRERWLPFKPHYWWRWYRTIWWALFEIETLLVFLRSWCFLLWFRTVLVVRGLPVSGSFPRSDFNFLMQALREVLMEGAFLTHLVFQFNWLC